MTVPYLPETFLDHACYNTVGRPVMINNSHIISNHENPAKPGVTKNDFDSFTSNCNLKKGAVKTCCDPKNTGSVLQYGTIDSNGKITVCPVADEQKCATDGYKRRLSYYETCKSNSRPDCTQPAATTQIGVYFGIGIAVTVFVIFVVSTILCYKGVIPCYTRSHSRFGYGRGNEYGYGRGNEYGYGGPTLSVRL